jgi:voltage-gated potassium channel
MPGRTWSPEVGTPAGGPYGDGVSHWRRLAGALVALLLVLVIGTVGYLLLGFGLLDAVYQAVTTVSTVGFREVVPLSAVGKVFTMVLILLGVGAAFYCFSVLIETFIEGRLIDLLGRRRMDKSVAALHDHVIICGWGRVGRSIAREVTEAGRGFVVVETDAAALAGAQVRAVVGDATEDAVLRAAGIERAAALVAAVDEDASNSFIALSGRALNPGLFIVARARSQDSEQKLLRAGADRVVNPQSIGGSRMAAFVLRPHVAEFLDVVMHERNIEFRLEEVPVAPTSPLVGCTLHDSNMRADTGALVLALREEDGTFQTNPPPDTVIRSGQVIIAIGTQDELDALGAFVVG